MKKNKTLLILSLSLGCFLLTPLSSCGTSNVEEVKEFTISLNYDASMGTVSVDKENGKVGETVAVTITPKEGFSVSSVNINGVKSTNELKQTFVAMKGENIVIVDFTKGQSSVDEDCNYFINTIFDETMGHVMVEPVSGDNYKEARPKVTIDVFDGYKLDNVLFNEASLGADMFVFELTNVQKGDNTLKIEFSKDNIIEPVKDEFFINVNYDNSLGEVRLSEIKGYLTDNTRINFEVLPFDNSRVSSISFNDVLIEINEDNFFEVKPKEGENNLDVIFEKNSAESQAFIINLDINNTEGGTVEVDKREGHVGEKLNVKIDINPGFILSSLAFNDTELPTNIYEFELTPIAGINNLVVIFGKEDQSLIDELANGQTYLMDLPNRSEESDLTDAKDIASFYKKYFSEDPNATFEMEEAYLYGGEEKYLTIFDYLRKNGITKSDVEKIEKIYGESALSSNYLLFLAQMKASLNDYNIDSLIKILSSTLEVFANLKTNFSQDKLLSIIILAYKEVTNSSRIPSNLCGPSGLKSRDNALKARDYFARNNNKEAVERIDSILNNDHPWLEEKISYTITKNDIFIGNLIYYCFENCLTSGIDFNTIGKYFYSFMNILSSFNYPGLDIEGTQEELNSVKFFSKIISESLPSYSSFIAILPELENLDISDNLILFNLLSNKVLAYDSSSDSLINLIKENKETFYYSLKFILKSIGEADFNVISSLLKSLDTIKTGQNRINKIGAAKRLITVIKYFEQKVKESGQCSEKIKTYLSNFTPLLSVMLHTIISYKNGSISLSDSSETIYLRLPSNKYDLSSSEIINSSFISLSGLNSDNLSKEESEIAVNNFEKLHKILGSFISESTKEYTVKYNSSNSDNSGFAITNKNNENVSFSVKVVQNSRYFKNLYQITTEDDVVIYYRLGDDLIVEGDTLPTFNFTEVDESGKLISNNYSNFKYGVYYLEKGKKYYAIESMLEWETITNVDTSTIGEHYLYVKNEKLNKDIFLTCFVYEKNIDYYSFERLNESELRLAFTIHCEDYTYSQNYIYGYQKVKGYAGIEVTLRNDQIEIEPLDYFVDVSEGTGERYFDVLTKNGEKLRVRYLVAENVSVKNTLSFINDRIYFNFEKAPKNIDNCNVTLDSTFSYQFNGVTYIKNQKENTYVHFSNFVNDLDNSTPGWHEDVYDAGDGIKYDVKYYVRKQVDSYEDVYFPGITTFSNYDTLDTHVEKEYTYITFGDCLFYENEDKSLTSRFIEKETNKTNLKIITSMSDFDLSYNGFHLTNSKLQYVDGDTGETKEEVVPVMYYVAEATSVFLQGEALKFDLNNLPDPDSLISIICKQTIYYESDDGSSKFCFSSVDRKVEIKFSELGITKEDVDLGFIWSYSAVIDELTTLMFEYEIYTSDEK